ncbi:MAG: DEAD/DEAH box helicase [Frankiaceae bacterium]
MPRTSPRPRRTPDHFPRTNRRPRAAQPRRAPAAPAPSAIERELDAALNRPAPPASTFASLGLAPALVTALARRGVHEPFAIQARALPDALAGHDVLGRAQTGSGKTLAFGLPMITRLAGSTLPRQPKAPRGLVLVPTRELATQVADALRPLADALGLRLVAVFGGVPYGRQIDALLRGVDIVVATPGRLIDLLDRGAGSLHRVEVSVVDEADHMADLGFLPAVTRLLGDTPQGGQRMLFSATLDRGVERLVHDYLVDPVCHAVAAAAAPVESMEHRVFTVRPEDKLAVTAEVAARPARTLLFVRTKHGADRLARQLTRAGVEAAAIHGNLTQSARQRALDGFSAGSPRVLVATDVAARGIHVDGVDLVVHFDPPNDHKDYLHRSGRTARAGERGTVLSLVHPEQVRDLAKLHADARVEALGETVRPGHEAVRALAESGAPVVLSPPRGAPTTTSTVTTGKARRHGQDRRRHRSPERPTTHS